MTLPTEPIRHLNSRTCFPILGERGTLPRAVPWSLVESHERQAYKNHGQTLARLAERGGLAPCELLAVLQDRKWQRMSFDDAVAGVHAFLTAHDMNKSAVDP